MIDPGFDWFPIIRRERVSRLLAAPFFAEAGALFIAAHALWRGPHGGGRLRGKELLELGQRLENSAEFWRRSALGWADSPLLPNNEDGVGPLLARYVDVRHARFDASEKDKHPVAARRLVAGGIALVERGIALVRRTGDELHRRKEAEDWEDRLEDISGSPAAQPPSPPLTEEQLRCLEARAVYRACQGLSATAHRVLTRKEKPARGKALAFREERERRCLEDEARFRTLAETCYLGFIDKVDGDTQTAMLQGCDDTPPNPLSYDQHHETEAAITKAVHIVDALVTGFLGLLDGPDGTSTRLDAVNALLLPPKTA